MKMKINQLAKIKILIFGISLFFFTACETENEVVEENLITEKQVYSIEKVKFSEFENNTKLLETMSELNASFKTKNNSLATRSNSSEQIYDLNTNEAIYIENKDGTQHSYTFAIETEDENYNIENIVLSSQENGTYKAYLTTYMLNEQQRTDLNNGVNVDLTEKSSIQEIDDSQVNLYKSFGCTYELTTVYIEVACSIDGCWEPEWTTWETMQIWVEVCSGGGGGGSGDGSGSGSGTGGGGGGGTSGGSGNDNNIPTIPMNPDGTSAAPSFLINALGGESQLTSRQISWINNHENDALVNLLLNAFPTSNSNAITAALSALMNNADIPWELIEDWFLNTPDYTEPNLNIDPNNITYDTPLIQQELPSFEDFVDNFPKRGTAGNYSEMPTTNVYHMVGGSLLNSHLNNPSAYSNACSIRGSRGLLYSGISIPVLNYPGVGQRTQKGGDNNNYILDAVSFDKYMRDKFGDATHELTGTDANDPVKVANLLNGKNGIYVIINSSHAQAGYSGHVDAIINGDCISNAYTTPSGGVKSIRIWALN